MWKRLSSFSGRGYIRLRVGGAISDGSMGGAILDVRVGGATYLSYSILDGCVERNVGEAMQIRVYVVPSKKHEKLSWRVS